MKKWNYKFVVRFKHVHPVYAVIQPIRYILIHHKYIYC